MELGNNTGCRRVRSFSPDGAFRIVLGLFLVLSFALSVLIPAWEANDEPDHFRNVQTLVSGRWYRMEPGAGYAAHQAPLYYLGLAAIQKVVGLSAFTPTLVGNPNAPQLGQYVHNDADSQRRATLLRLPSIILGALTVWLTRRVAMRVGVNEWGAVLAAAIVATLPRFVFLSSVITNDGLVITLGAWATLLAAGLVCDTHVSRLRLVGFGAVLGLMLEAKLSAMPIVFALACGVIAARFFVLRSKFRSQSGGVGQMDQVGGVSIVGSKVGKVGGVGKVGRAGSVGALGKVGKVGKIGGVGSVGEVSGVGAGGTSSVWASCSIVVGLLLVAAPILISNQSRYGDPLASKASVDYFRELLPPLVAVPHTWGWFGPTVASGFATSFWYVSGWNQFRWKAETYVPLWLLVIIGLLGCAVPRSRSLAKSRVSGPASGERANSRDGGSAAERNPRVGVPSGFVTTRFRTVGTFARASQTRPSDTQPVGNGVVGLLFGVVGSGVAVVWLLATQTTQWQARTSFPSLAALATLIAVGYRRLRIPVALQFALPALTLAGTLYAIHTDVINRYFL